MKQHVIFALLALLALPCVLSTAYAEDGAASSVRISGFGSGALTWLDTDQAQFARPNQPAGAGKSPRTGVDSNLGLQADYPVNRWLSLTAQGVVRKDGEDDVGADLSWAFVKARVADALSVRVGRIGLPVFMISDYRSVGYANNMLRPPQEVYSQIPTSHIDGGDIICLQNIAGTTFTAQLALGRTKDGPAVVSGEHALNLVAEHGPVTLRVGHADGTLSLPIPAGPPGADGRMPTFTLTQKVSFTSAGAMLDWNNIVAQTEVAKAHGIGETTLSWYTMAGYRVGKLLPFYNHGMTTGIKAQSSDSVGLRWDAFRSAAIKVQVDRIQAGANGHGLLVQVHPGFHGPVTAGAVAIDFVF